MTDPDPASVALFSLIIAASAPSRAAIYRATLGDLYPVPGDDRADDIARCDRLNKIVDAMMNRVTPGIGETGLRLTAMCSEEEALYLAALDSLEDLEDELYPI